MSDATDPHVGSYVRQGTTLYYVLCLERDDQDTLTGLYVLENAHGERSASKTYVHRRVITSETALTTEFVLVKSAIPTVPDYLDAEMEASWTG